MKSDANRASDLNKLTPPTNKTMDQPPRSITVFLKPAVTLQGEEQGRLHEMVKCTDWDEMKEWYSFVPSARKGRYTACPGYASRWGRTPEGQSANRAQGSTENKYSLPYSLRRANTAK